MNWFSWLSKTNLDPSLTYEYALSFAHNELEEDDIPHLDHEFLQSMGISIAKHRLEILKLAKTEKKKKKNTIRPVLWFKFAIKQTRHYLAKQVETIFVHHHRENAPLSIVPKRNQSMRWKVAMLQRNKRLKMPHVANNNKANNWPMLRSDDDSTRFVPSKGLMMLTNGSAIDGSDCSGSSQSSDWGESDAHDESGNICNSSFSRTTIPSPEGENCSSSMEEIKWDSMFKNLKPT